MDGSEFEKVRKEEEEAGVSRHSSVEDSAIDEREMAESEEDSPEDDDWDEENENGTNEEIEDEEEYGSDKDDGYPELRTGPSSCYGSCPVGPGQGGPDFKGFSMRWFAFFVNILLPFVTVLSLFQIYKLLSNFSALVESINLQMSVSPLVGAYSIITVISLLVMSVLGILVFWNLRSYRLLGYRLYWVFLGAFILFRVLFILIASLLAPESGLAELSPSFMIIIYGLTGLYLRKRKAVFI